MSVSSGLQGLEQRSLHAKLLFSKIRHSCTEHQGGNGTLDALLSQAILQLLMLQ